MMSKTIQLLILAIVKIRTKLIYSTNYVEYCMLCILILRKGDFIKHDQNNKSTLYN